METVLLFIVLFIIAAIAGGVGVRYQNPSRLWRAAQVLFMALSFSSIAFVFAMSGKYLNWRREDTKTQERLAKMSFESSEDRVRWLEKQERWFAETIYYYTDPHTGRKLQMQRSHFNPEWRMQIGISLFVGGLSLVIAEFSRAASCHISARRNRVSSFRASE